jgi:uncharacterized repeat protein (TIGR03803 family)
MKAQRMNRNFGVGVRAWLGLPASTLLAFSAVLVAVTGAPAEEASQSITYVVMANLDLTTGIWPGDGLIADPAGNLYGTTQEGGAYGYGTVFELPTTGAVTVLYNFTGQADGAYPTASLLRKPDGTLYGTAEFGGIFNSTCTDGCGVVFELSAQGKQRVLYSFTGGGDGYGPYSNLIRDDAGNLYGVVPYGGVTASCVLFGNVGCGVVYELSPTGKETVLHAFTGGADGANPDYGLLRDSAGYLYGTTTDGGNLSLCMGYGCGVVFSLAPNGTERMLYTFTGGSDGGDPSSGLTEDSAGNFYGTTALGGDVSCHNGTGTGCGVVFELSPAGTETVLHTFTGPDGIGPAGGLLRQPSSGTIYGVASAGGADGVGCIFAISASGKQGILHSFGGADGAIPNEIGGLIFHGGQIYGTAAEGGLFGQGVAFRLSR